MYLIKYIILGLIFPVMVLANENQKPDEMQPTERVIQLKEFTRFTVDIVPDLGVRFIFPFLLNENDDIIPFQSVMTNNTVFSIDRPGQNDKSNIDIPHNMFVLTLKKDGLCKDMNNKDICSKGIPQHLGSLFITAGGYNISVKLRSTGDLDKHKDDIVFNLSTDEKTHLINRAVEARMINYDKKYKEKLNGIDKLVEQKAIEYIGFLAIQTPVQYSVKEEFEPRFKQGGQAEIYLEEILEYNTYLMLVFEVENKSVFDLNVTGIELNQVVNETKSIIHSNLSCPKKWRPDKIYRCVLVTQSRSLLDADKLSMSLSTDRGQVELSW